MAEFRPSLLTRLLTEAGELIYRTNELPIQSGEEVQSAITLNVLHMPTVKEIAECFELLFTAFHAKEFTKSHRLVEWRERELLPLIRVGLLCYFGQKALLEVEVRTP